MLTHLDLFSGIGGFAIAANNCGFTTVAFCEIEPYAQQILIEKFGAVLADAVECAELTGKPQPGQRAVENGYGKSARLHPDIFTIPGSDYAGVSLLTGGFPCQPFSVAGKRRGAADDRALWPQMLRVIAEARPRWIVGENVAGIVTMELDRCLSDLENLGYSARAIVVPACAVDAKHRRDRVWIVAHTDARDEWRQGDAAKEHGRRQSNRGCEGVETPADADQPGPQGRNGDKLRERRGERALGASGSHCAWQDERDWFAESGMGRVSHGISNRAHRLRALGNAIVPQVAEEIIRAIAEQIADEDAQHTQP